MPVMSAQTPLSHTGRAPWGDLSQGPKLQTLKDAVHESPSCSYALSQEDWQIFLVVLVASFPITSSQLTDFRVKQSVSW